MNYVLVGWYVLEKENTEIVSNHTSRSGQQKEERRRRAWKDEELRKADEQEAGDSGSKKQYAVSGNELIAVNSASSVRPLTKIPSWPSILFPFSARQHLRTLKPAKPP